MYNGVNAHMEVCMESTFSIYKIDVEFVWKNMMMKLGQEYDYDIISNFIINVVRDNANISADNHFIEQQEEDYFLIYTKENIPGWFAPITGNFEANYEKKKYMNKSVSFVMLTIMGDGIYATTGGYASSFVKFFCIKNFGLILLTKLYGQNDPVIQELTEMSTVGPRAAQTATNRATTTFIGEKDYSIIFKKISTTSNYSVLEQLDLLEPGDTPTDYKEHKIISTDALNIRKKISFSQYKRLLDKIDEKYNVESNFSLSYFVPSNLYKITNTMATTAFIEELLDNPQIVDEVLVVGDDYSEYYNCSEWELFYNDESILITEKPLKFINIYEKFKEREKKISKSSLGRLLKDWKVSAKNADGESPIYKKDIKSILDYSFTSTFALNIEGSESKEPIEIEYTVYLNSGSWYILDHNYTKFIDIEFEQLLERSSGKLEAVYIENELNISKSNESEYNASFINSKRENVIHCDEKYHLFIEICDLMVFTDDNVYFICNKSYPTGLKARDLLNQIHAAANIIQKDKNAMKKYYEKLLKNNEIKESFLTCDEFINRTKNPIFVSAYTQEVLTPSSRSTYAKLLTIETNSLLNKLGYQLMVTSPLLWIEKDN